MPLKFKGKTQLSTQLPHTWPFPFVLCLVGRDCQELLCQESNFFPPVHGKNRTVKLRYFIFSHMVFLLPCLLDVCFVVVVLNRKD